MKNLQRPSSCNQLKRLKFPSLITLETSETPPTIPNPHPTLSETIAQKIPRLPESKFFPSSTRRINSSLTSEKFSNLSVNSSLNQSTHKTTANISNRNSFANEGSLKASQQNPEPEKSHSWTDMHLPTTPSIVIGKFREILSKYELAEVFKFPEIYYIGVGAKKTKNSSSPSENFNFDDEAGDYKAIIHDHIAYRFEVFEVLGKGSFGQVFRVFDHKHKSFCALKIIKNIKRFSQQALIEIDILRHLRKADEGSKANIVHIQSSFSFRSHICISFELLSMNLYSFLKLNKFQGLAFTLVKRFAVQVLQALDLMQRNNIIHCDLKPENILLKHPNRSSIKIIDFGSSCFDDKKVFTYIQSRFYRAPEIILGVSYSTRIDMWSLGCIVAELILGHPLFPGENETQQILNIMEFLGQPPVDFLLRSSRKKLFFDGENRPKVLKDAKGNVRKPGSKNFRELFNGVDDGLADLVIQCLKWEPDERISASHALLKFA